MGLCFFGGGGNSWKDMLRKLFGYGNERKVVIKRYYRMVNARQEPVLRQRRTENESAGEKVDVRASMAACRNGQNKRSGKEI